MRHLVLSICILCSTFAYTQNYKFNKLVKYNIQTKDVKNSIVMYMNSNYDGYHMYVDKIENKLSAKLYDFEKSVIHNYNVLESKSNNNDIMFEFKYESTSKLPKYFDNTKYAFEFEAIDSDSLSKKIALDISSNPKNKRRKTDNCVRTIVLNVRNYNENLFDAFKASCIFPFEYIEDLNFEENGIIESATTYCNDYVTTYTLEHLSNINLNLKAQTVKQLN